MDEPKRVDIEGSMRLCYEDEGLGLNVSAEGSHVGSNYRSEEFDFCYARDAYYDSILHAAQTLASQGKHFSLYTNVQADGIFPISFSGHISHKEGVVALDFWPFDTKNAPVDPVYCEFNASPKGVLDAISLVYGGFISACHTLTPNDIDLRDETIYRPYCFFSGVGFPSDDPTLHDLVYALAEREEKQHVKNLDSMIREAKATFERIAGNRSTEPNREEPGR